MRRFKFLSILVIISLFITGIVLTSTASVNAQTDTQQPQDAGETSVAGTATGVYQTSVADTATSAYQTSVAQTATSAYQTSVAQTATSIHQTSVAETATSVHQTSVAQTVLAITPTPSNTPLPLYSRPILTLSGYDYGKDYVYAGESFKLATQFTNSGQMTAYNITVSFSSNEFTTSATGGVSLISSIGTGNSNTIDQDFVVNDSVSSSPGTINVTVTYKDVNGVSYNQTFALSITVYYSSSTDTPTPTQTGTAVGRPQLVIKSFSVDNKTIQPGSTFTLTMDVQNTGIFDAINVMINIGATSSTSSTSTTNTTSSNFLPINSSNIQAIGNLGTQKDVQITQSFTVSSSATGGSYALPIQITYYNPSGTSFTDSQNITLMIYQVPQIEVSFYETPSTFTVGTQGTLPIQVINLGTSAFLFGDLNVTTDNATLSNNSAFIGSLDSGSSYTQDVDFTPTKSGDYTITITINYQDSFNNTQKISKTLTVNVPESGAGAGVSGTPGTTANSTQAALMETAIAGGGGFPGGTSTTTTSSNSLWQIILRGLRGLLGFDSGTSTSTASSAANLSRSFTRATATP